MLFGIKPLEGWLPKIGSGPETELTVTLRLEGIDAIEKGVTKPLDRCYKQHLSLIGFDINGDPKPAECHLCEDDG